MVDADDLAVEADVSGHMVDTPASMATRLRHESGRTSAL